jgi:endonuclease G
MSTQRARSLRSWVPIDADYGNRGGFDPKFLGGVTVGLPRADGSKLKAADLLPALSYQHFSVRLHRRRKLAAFTAVNISGAERYQRTGRAEDSWEVDPRAAGFQTTQPAYRAPFHRGHLVMRLDPVWGRADIAERAEADTFHWSNCAPQHRRLNNPWWLSVEKHVLETARVTGQRVSVFSGPVLSVRDPWLYGVKVPLAYWKVIAWRTPGRTPGRAGGLRSLGFIVRQDPEVRAAVQGARAVPRALGFEDTPTKVQGYQVRVTKIQELTGLRFGGLAAPAVDVFARPKAGRTRAVARGEVSPDVRVLRGIGDLVVE